MSDQAVITNQDNQPQNPAPDKPLIEEIRNKSFAELLKDQAEEAKQAQDKENEEPQETEEEKKKREEDEKAAKDAEEAKQKVEEEEAAKKRDAEIAKQAADAVLEKQKEEEQAKENKIKEEEETKKREEELKPRFTGKDKDGNTVPKDYNELVSESARIGKLLGKEEALAEIDAREKAAKDKIEADKAEKAKVEADQKEQNDRIEKQIQEEVNDIYAAGGLPKVKDLKDVNDPGYKEFAHLFEIAKTVNEARIKAGKAPILSPKIIRYGKDETGKPYYTPLVDKPAGHDAPVIGSQSTISKDLPQDKYIPSRDRHKSMSQLIREEAARLGKKVGVRGQ